MNAKTLALRDSALASLLGAIDESDFGVDFGDDYGYDFGDDGAPAPAQAMKAWQKEKAHTDARTLLLEPNKHSRVKVERYTFGVTQALVLGTASAIDTSGNPDVNIRPQRVVCNAPVPGFATLSDIRVANVSIGVGGSMDAFQFAAQAVGTHLDMPTLSPSNRARVTGNYLGLTPTGYTAAAAYTFITSFTGPATIVA